MYDAVVGLPIQPTTSSREVRDPAGRASDRRHETVVSTQVGIIVTAGLKRRA